MMRNDGRVASQMRPVKITRRYLRGVEGSVLIEMGHTRVLCSATVDEKVPPFLKGKGQGWLTGEYGMLPRSSPSRIDREAVRGKVQGRTQEIMRLIGRALRSTLDMKALGERQLIIDCDVIQADGGTRCAAITGGFIAAVDALRPLVEAKLIPRLPFMDYVAAISVGIIEGEPRLDLHYDEDSTAVVDMNVVGTGEGNLVEVGSTAEHGVFNRAQFSELLDLGQKGVAELIALQKKELGALDAR
jgi:ribonuclease PH